MAVLKADCGLALLLDGFLFTLLLVPSLTLVCQRLSNQFYNYVEEDAQEGNHHHPNAYPAQEVLFLHQDQLSRVILQLCDAPIEVHYRIGHNDLDEHT